MLPANSDDGGRDMNHVQLPPVQRDIQLMTIREFLDNLAGLDFDGQNKFDIWEYTPCGNLVGFGESGRRVVRSIAHYLRGLHVSSMYCSNIFGRVYIEGNSMTVCFPCTHVKDNCILRGIQQDTKDFKLFVEQLIQLTNQYHPLPEDLSFFSSQKFINGLSSSDLTVVKEYSFLQLFHPATFNNADRIHFIDAIVAYRNQMVDAFETGLNLHHKAYGLHNWKSRFNKDHTLYSVMERSLYKSKLRPNTNTKTNHCASIPWFLRCVHHHFAEHEKAKAEKDGNYKQRSHGEIFEIVHRELPAVYSKILDAMLQMSRSTIAQTLEDEAYGFKSDKIRV